MGHKTETWASVMQDKCSGLKETYQGDCPLLLLGFQLPHVLFK